MDQQAIRDFVLEYVSELKDLTFNSKSLINTLTMLAGDTPEAASSITAAIEKHILTVRLVSYHLSFTPLTALCVQAIRIQCSTEKLILSSHSPGLQCAPNHKLYALYLVDSIAKNIGVPYTTLFAGNMPEVRRSFSCHICCCRNATCDP